MFSTISHSGNWLPISLDCCPFITIFNLKRHSSLPLLVYYAVFQKAMQHHSKTKLIRRLSVLHNFPLLQMNVHFIELLPIYHCFQFEETLVLAYTAHLHCTSEKYVTPTKKSILVRSLYILHNVLLWELSLHFIELLPICNCFWFDKALIWLIMLYYAAFENR
jgi:hypothetical protein